VPELPEPSPGSPPVRIATRVSIPVESSAYKLPLTLSIQSLKRTPDSVDVGALITDAAGVSVRFMPITMGPKTSPAEICAIMQSTVSSLAAVMHGRKDAILEETPSTDADFSALVSKTFSGSVAL
jgi:hypothetical protein